MAREMGVTKAFAQQAAADSRGSRTCVCANTFPMAQGEKDELTSCRGTVQPAWQKPPVTRKGGHVVRGRQSSPIPAQQPAVYRWQ